MAYNLILVGLSGSGKTVVGRKAARLLGWLFVDLDEEIARSAGKPVKDIFAEDGEARFRELERDVLRQACLGERVVVSTGGGAVEDSESRHLMLERGLVLWLDARPETLHRRLTRGGPGPVESRPMLAGSDPLGRIQELRRRRQRYYEEAHHRLDTGTLTPQEAAREVVRLLGAGRAALEI